MPTSYTVPAAPPSGLKFVDGGLAKLLAFAADQDSAAPTPDWALGKSSATFHYRRFAPRRHPRRHLRVPAEPSRPPRRRRG